MKLKSIAVAVALSSSFAGHAAAGSGMYFGASAGVSEMTALKDSLNNLSALYRDFGAGDSTSDYDKPSSFALFVGFRFSDYVSVETGYADLGRHKATVATNFGVASATESFNYAASAYFIDAIGSYPVSKNFSVYGKIGYADVDVGDDYHFIDSAGFTAAGSFPQTTKTLKVGLGAKYRITKRIGIRLDLDQYRDVSYASVSVADAAEKTNLNNYAISAEFHF